MLLKNFDFEVKPFEEYPCYFDPTTVVISDLCFELPLGRILKINLWLKQILFFYSIKIVFYRSFDGVLNSCLLL